MGIFYPRGVAIDAYPFRLINKNDGTVVTSGTVTVLVSKDGGAQAASTNTPVHNGSGEWLLDITATERDCERTSLIISHADIVPMHIVITSDSELGPGAKQITVQFGRRGKNASVWLVYADDVDTVVASGETGNTGEIIFYLDDAEYYLYFQKPGINFNNPYSIAVTAIATFDLSAQLSQASAAFAATAYATLDDAHEYFSTRLHTDAWDNATDIDKQKALVMATRAIDRLDYQGSPTTAALDLGNQFPRGTDTEIPDEIVWATCEEAFTLLSRKTEDEYDSSRIIEEKFSGATVRYDPDNIPRNILSGIMSAEAWKYLLLYLRDDRSVALHRV